MSNLEDLVFKRGPQQQPKTDFLDTLFKRTADAAEPILQPPASPPGDGIAVYVQRACQRAGETIANTPEGRRNGTLNAEAFSLGTLVGAGVLDEGTARSWLMWGARSCRLPDVEARKTITSGLTKGKTKPRDLSGIGHPLPPLPQLVELPGGLQNGPKELVTPGRVVVDDLAANVAPARVQWLWEGRLALGSLALLAGREGVGKSTVAYWLAARATRGELPGEHLGQPRDVLVCATEDSWAHTIVPRLIAAGADLHRVRRIRTRTADGLAVEVRLPLDNDSLAELAARHGAVLLLFDPLMSRLGSLDTHKDAEVRQALEPLTAIAERTGMTVLGLIHHNKSGSADPLDVLMGSRAFAAVARTVLTVVTDPDDETGARRLLGLAKNNLGRLDQPLLPFTIASYAVPTSTGPAETGRLEWGEPIAGGSLLDVMREPEVRTAERDAADWLHDYLAMNGGIAPSADCKREGQKVGHSDRTLRRAMARLRCVVTSHGYPRTTYWELPGTQIASQASADTSPNLGPTGPTGPTESPNP